MACGGGGAGNSVACVCVCAQNGDEVGNLVLRLPQAKNAPEVFSVFAEHVARMFVGVLHIRWGAVLCAVPCCVVVGCRPL